MISADSQFRLRTPGTVTDWDIGQLQSPANEMQSAMSPATATSKRRWYQFRLLTLLVAVTTIGIGLGLGLKWWHHRTYCLRRAAYHRYQRDTHKLRLDALDRLLVRYGLNIDTVFDRATHKDKINIQSRIIIRDKIKEHKTGIERHDRLAVSFDLAIWRPWLRFGIETSENAQQGAADP